MKRNKGICRESCEHNTRKGSIGFMAVSLEFGGIKL